WGVVGFQVGRIPPGVPPDEYKVAHAPTETDYPHSEVKAYRDGRHLTSLDDIDDTEHLLWRGRLLLVHEVMVKPKEKVEIRKTRWKSDSSNI
ncbi:MAG: hypothetical protein ACRDD1_19400, partial [Planctomycetia bacterium]